MIPNPSWYLFDEDLHADEEVLWADQPDPTVLFAKQDRGLVPFSLIWGGFALFWEGVVIAALVRGERHSGNGGNLWFFAITGLITVAFGFYFIFGRFIYKSLRKRHTYYAVTNKRVLVLTTLRRRKLDAAFIDQIPTVREVVNSAGFGTLYFGEGRWWRANYGNTGMDIFGSAGGVLAFYDIREAKGVSELVNGLRETLKASAAP